MLFLLFSNLLAFEASIEKKDDKTYLFFPTYAKLVTFIDNGIWFACFEMKKKFTLPQESTYFLSSGNVSSTESLVIFSFKPKPFIGVEINRRNNGWLFKFECKHPLDITKEHKKKSGLFSFSSRRKGYFLHIDNKEFFVVPNDLYDQGYRSFSYTNLSAKPAYAIQGASFEVLTHFFTTKKQNNEQSISCHRDEIFLDWRVESVFKNYQNHTIFKDVWNALLKCDGPKATALLNTMAHKNSFIKHISLFQRLKGIALFLSQKYNESLNAMALLPPYEEVEIWRSLAQVLSGVVQEIDLETVFQYLRTYPKSIQLYLREKISPFVRTMDKENSEKWLDIKDIPLTSKRLLNIIEFYKTKIALSHLGMNATKMSVDFKKIFQDNNTPPELAVASKFEWIKANTDNKLLPLKEGIVMLDQLRVKQRREDVEFPLSLYLASLYQKEKNHKKAVEILKNLQHLYPVRFYLENTFLLIHDLIKDMMKVKDEHPLKVISVYDDFYDWFSSNDLKEEFTDVVVSNMVKIGLFKEAGDLYIQVAEEEKNLKIKNNLYLKGIKIYNYAEEFNESLRITEMIDETFLNDQQKKKKLYLYAEALYQTNQHEKANALLSASQDLSDMHYRAKQLIKNQQFTEATLVLEQILSQTKTKKEKEEIEQDLILSYVEMEKFENLKPFSQKKIKDPFSSFLLKEKHDQTLPRNRKEVSDIVGNLNSFKKVIETFQKE